MAHKINVLKSQIKGSKDQLGDFYGFPRQIFKKIINYYPITCACLNKFFYKFVSSDMSELRSIQNSSATPSVLKERIAYIQNKLRKKTRFRVTREFFLSDFFLSSMSQRGITLNKMDPIPIDFSNLGNEMLAAFQPELDDNLSKCWSKIRDRLDINLPMNSDEIRNWMMDANNQQKLAEIKDLDLSSLDLTLVPDKIIYFSGLETLNLDSNRLKVLPDLICNLKGLKELKLNQNKLRYLPRSFGDLLALEKLQVNQNHLIDFPNSFGGFVALKELDANCNKLSSLPNSFGSLTALESLSLNNNNLNYLPDSFGSLAAF